VLDELDEGESGMLASFPRNMRQFIRDYKRDNPIYDKDAYYLFVIKDAPSGRAGFMPFKRQFGFVFSNKTPNLERTIAHELGHGAFRLRHTFSSKDFIANQGETDNLMDYSQGNHLHKQQWDYIHHPQDVIGWFEDDEEGEEKVRSNGILIASFENSLLKPSKISINYRLHEWRKKMKELYNIENANLNDYQLLLFVEYERKFVYHFMVDLKESGNIKWHGLVYQGDVLITSKNRDDFKLHLGIIKKPHNDHETFKHWVVSIGTSVESTIIYPPGNRAGTVKFVDLLEDLKFEINAAWEEWQEYDENNLMQLANLNRYQERRIQYIDRLELLGIDTKSTDPIQYLNEHLVQGDFLGQNIPSINIRFLYFLRKLEEKLGRGKTWSGNSSNFNRLCSLAPNIEDFARMSSVGSSLSDHGTGFAFDFEKDKNPWLDSDNYYQDKLIQIVTGKKMINYTYDVYYGDGASEIKQASDNFLERIEGNGFDISNSENLEYLVNLFKNISDYSEKISLINTDKSTEFNDLLLGVASKIEDFVVYDPNILQSELQTQKQNLLNDVEATSKFFELYITGLDELKLLFDASKSCLFVNYDMGENYEKLYSYITDNKTKINSIIAYLESIVELSTSSGMAWNNGINTIKNNLSSISFSSGYQTYLTQFVTKFNEKKNILGSEIKEFPNRLKDETNKKKCYMGGTLFENGFCSLDESLVKSIIQTKVTLNNVEMRLMWGGSYYSTKDIMHFELRKQAGSSERPYQKAVHSVIIQDIKNYLNSFKNRYGAEYDY